MIWLLKIFFKLLISRITLLRKLFEIFGFFKLGKMDSLKYSNKIFKLHLNQYIKSISPKTEFLSNKDKLTPVNAAQYLTNMKKSCRDKVMLEIGPGNSIISALYGYGSGFTKIYLIDVGNFATKNLKFYKNAAPFLKREGLRIPDIYNAKSVEEILNSCNAKYLTNGLESLKDIETNSVDFVFSSSVLEHIRKRELPETIIQLRRIMKKEGISSHNIDFQDHLSNSLNHLRFSERIWESELFYNSGFYTNRVPANELHKIFENNGFEIITENFGKWEDYPISRNSLNKSFKKFSKQQLLNRTSYIKLRCR